MDDAASRPQEMEVMGLLEQIARAVEEAEGLIQDDGHITGLEDRREIRAQMLHIRALTLEIDQLLGG